MNESSMLTSGASGGRESAASAGARVVAALLAADGPPCLGEVGGMLDTDARRAGAEGGVSGVLTDFLPPAATPADGFPDAVPLPGPWRGDLDEPRTVAPPLVGDCLGAGAGVAPAYFPVPSSSLTASSMELVGEGGLDDVRPGFRDGFRSSSLPENISSVERLWSSVVVLAFGGSAADPRPLFDPLDVTDLPS